MNLSQQTEDFKQQIIDSGIIDREGMHHVFSQGLHGRKIDFDLIPDDSKLFRQWVELTADFIKNNYQTLPEVVVGVANGTNRLSAAVAEKLGNNIAGLVTYKPEGSRNQPILSEEVRQEIQKIMPSFVIILEDVGTRGTNSASVANSLRDAGFNNLEVINTWQRSDTLQLLDEANVKYEAVIKDVLTNYSQEECESIGFCSKGWKLLGHGQ